MLGSGAFWLLDKVAGPAVVALVFTQIINFRLERFKADRDYATKIVDGLCKDLVDLRATSMAYWSRAYAVGDKSIEAQITASQNQILSVLSLLHEDYGIFVFADDSPEILELLDSLTGGKFRSPRRSADPDRVVRCAAILSKLWRQATVARASHLKGKGRTVKIAPGGKNSGHN